jgi:PII-like signaling protein
MLQAQLFIDLDEMRGDQLLHDYVIKFLSQQNIAGATSFRGYAGFGKHHRVKYPRDLFSFDEAPAMILFMDEESKVRKAVEELRKVLPRQPIFILHAEEV